MLKNNKGFTLTEVVASMAIMSLIAISLLMVISVSYINTFNLKEKEEVSNKLNEISEAIYNKNMNAEDIVSFLELKGGNEVEKGNLKSNDSMHIFNFYVSDLSEFIEGSGNLKHKIFVFYFYKNEIQGGGQGLMHKILVPNNVS